MRWSSLCAWGWWRAYVLREAEEEEGGEGEEGGGFWGAWGRLTW